MSLVSTLVCGTEVVLSGYDGRKTFPNLTKLEIPEATQSGDNESKVFQFSIDIVKHESDLIFQSEFDVNFIVCLKRLYSTLEIESKGFSTIHVKLDPDAIYKTAIKNGDTNFEWDVICLPFFRIPFGVYHVEKGGQHKFEFSAEISFS